MAERDLRVTADSGEQLLENVQRHLLWQAYQSFAVIFWYFLLGPVAVLSYRLLALAQEHSQNPALVERAGQLRHAFDWLPVRLLAASFALVGNFAAVSRVMLHGAELGHQCCAADRQGRLCRRRNPCAAAWA